MSGVSDRELAKSTGSRRCSEGNSRSLPKWRKNSNKQKNVVQHKVSQVPTIHHKPWVNAKGKPEQSENNSSSKKCVLFVLETMAHVSSEVSKAYLENLRRNSD